MWERRHGRPCSAKGLTAVDQRFTHESVIGAFRQLYRPPDHGRALRRGRAQDQRQAYLTEISQIGLDPADPFPRGYVLSDT
jgi:proline racemase